MSARHAKVVESEEPEFDEGFEEVLNHEETIYDTNPEYLGTDIQQHEAEHH